MTMANYLAAMKDSLKVENLDGWKVDWMVAWDLMMAVHSAE